MKVLIQANIIIGMLVLDIPYVKYPLSSELSIYVYYIMHCPHTPPRCPPHALVSYDVLLLRRRPPALMSMP